MTPCPQATVVGQLCQVPGHPAQQVRLLISLVCVSALASSPSLHHMLYLNFIPGFQLITQQARKSFGLSGAQDRVSNDTLCNLGDSLHFWSCRPHL